MQTIIDDIKNASYKGVYLLYGQEEYLKKQYRKKLLDALSLGADQMNFARYEGKGVSETELIDLSETMPFFADHRVIVLENTGFYKNKTEKFADYLEHLPDYLVLIFVEDEVDKRGRMFKNTKKYGSIVEFKEQTSEMLTRWILGKLKKENKNITKPVMELFLEKTGTDMNRIQSELNKLLAYTMDKSVITAADVEEICTSRTENQIFAMIRAVSDRKQKEALRLYYDLLALKEPPMKILYLLAREFNLLLQTKELKAIGFDRSVMASKLGVAPFAVKNYMALSEKYTLDGLREAVEDFVQTETDVKTGKLSDTLSVELMITKYSN